MPELLPRTSVGHLIRLRKLRKVSRPIDPSRALTSDLFVPAPDGLAYDPYQVAGIEYASKRANTLIADDPGSGKTIMAIGVSNYFPAIQRVLIVCPGFLKPHWRNEWLKWDVKSLTVGIAEGQKGEFPQTDVVVINYDILKYYLPKIHEKRWDLLIVDEIHKLKTKRADRSRYVLGGIKRDANKKIIERCDPIPYRMVLDLTGTPTLNGKPKELWPIIQQLDPTGMGTDWFGFAKRYCKLEEIKRFNPAKGDYERIGWKWDGCENEEELQEYMRQRFMIRRLKADIMPQLKPKRRMIIPISLTKEIKKILGKEGLDYERTLRETPEPDIDTGFGDFSGVMKQIGLSLVKPTIDVLENDFDEFSKIVCMCYHNEVAEQIAEHFKGEALLINGHIAPAKRVPITEQFQTDPLFKLIVGTIGSCSEGLTMTAAHLMVLPERSWVPGSVIQAEDRIHRRGQKEQALYKHLVLEGGQSERQAKRLIEKQDSSDKLLDKKL